MKRWLLLCAAMIAACSPLSAQVADPEFDALQQGEMRRYVSLSKYLRTAADIKRVVDVKYYKLNIRIADQQNFLSGDVTSIAVVTEPVLAAFEFNLTNTMTVDSALVDGVRSAVTAAATSIRISLPRVYAAGDLITTRVFYHGLPAYTGLGSYADRVRADGSRWVYTLSEPYGARDWWPCVDHPIDKADSVDIAITCAQNLLAVTNGKLTGTVQNTDGTKTYQWKHRYPVATYLISATIGNFMKFSDWYKYSSVDSMEVVNYVLPGIDTSSKDYRANTALTPKMLAIYSALFGQYPFVKEKYGHAEFGWAGGMEHQTLTSLGSTSFSEGTIAHELAHQWFGDMITCRTWSDLWLNEGFAQYFESVYREKQYGTAAYVSSLQGRFTSAKNAQGTLYVQDTANVNNLFASSRVYNKGSWVLHMLRRAVGDSLFFASIRAYAADPALMYGTASTADLRAAFERTTKRDLGWFFSEWVYGERYPVYSCAYSAEQAAGSFFSTVSIKQTTGTTNPSFFVMPIDLKFSAPGWDTTVTVWNDAPNQMMKIPLSHLPVSMVVDPNKWILGDVATRLVVAGAEAETETPRSSYLAQNYPNPFNPSTEIRYGVAEHSHVVIAMFDVLGRKVATIYEGDKPAGAYAVALDASRLSSGMYLYRMTAQHAGSVFSETKRLLLAR